VSRWRRADFGGSVVYAVGASQGIGLAAARACAARGAHVAVFARRPGPLAQAVEAVEAARRDATQRVYGRGLDAADAAAAREALDEVARELGAPDLLLNLAGRARPGHFEDIGPAAFEATLRANLHTAWHASQAALPHMLGRGGTIVNTASLAGLIGIYGYTDYAAAKFAVVGFSEALRSELRPLGIDVRVLCPPDTDTPGFAEENRTKPPETAAVSKSAQLLSAEAVADALLQGLAGRRFLIVPGAAARRAALAKRLAPGLVARVTDRAVARARRAPG
jgi:3-dehydrosphinganine reductase